MPWRLLPGLRQNADEQVPVEHHTAS
jgi:hypothetical protein